MTVTEILAAIRRQTLVTSTTGDLSDADLTEIFEEGYNIVSATHRWPWLEASANLDVTAATVAVTLPTGFAFMRAIVRNGKSYSLQEIPQDKYLHLVGDNPTTSTDARFFYITNTTVGFYPTPSATEVGAYICFYYKNPTIPTGASSPEWASQFHHILVDYGSYRVWEREEYFDESQNAYGRFVRGLKDMIRFYNMRSMEGQLIYGDGEGFFWDSRNHLNIWNL